MKRHTAQPPKQRQQMKLQSIISLPRARERDAYSLLAKESNVRAIVAIAVHDRRAQNRPNKRKA
jgi:hypothetical protein